MMIVKCINDMVDGISMSKVYKVYNVIKCNDTYSYWLKDDYGVFNEFKADRFKIIGGNMNEY